MIPEEAKQLLEEFIKCGKKPYNLERAWEIAAALNTLGYTIWIGPNEQGGMDYSIVEKGLSRKLLLKEWEPSDDKNT